MWCPTHSSGISLGWLRTFGNVWKRLGNCTRPPAVRSCPHSYPVRPNLSPVRLCHQDGTHRNIKKRVTTVVSLLPVILETPSELATPMRRGLLPGQRVVRLAAERRTRTGRVCDVHLVGCRCRSICRRRYSLVTHGVLNFGLPRSSIQPLQWYEALVLSISSFHGRGLLPASSESG